jgi:hypothetical protein
MSKEKEKKIHQREDVNPEEGIKKYGDVDLPIRSITNIH